MRMESREGCFYVPQATAPSIFVFTLRWRERVGDAPRLLRHGERRARMSEACTRLRDTGLIYTHAT
jgi:hypothetical protein